MELDYHKVPWRSQSTTFPVHLLFAKFSFRYGFHYDFPGAFHNMSEKRLIMGEGRQFLDYSLRKDFTNEYV